MFLFCPFLLSKTNHSSVSEKLKKISHECQSFRQDRNTRQWTSSVHKTKDLGQRNVCLFFFYCGCYLKINSKETWSLICFSPLSDEFSSKHAQSIWLLSSGQDFGKKFLDSKHVLKVYFKPRRKNQKKIFLPLPSVPVWLNICYLSRNTKTFFWFVNYVSDGFHSVKYSTVICWFFLRLRKKKKILLVQSKFFFSVDNSKIYHNKKLLN